MREQIRKWVRESLVDRVGAPAGAIEALPAGSILTSRDVEEMISDRSIETLDERVRLTPLARDLYTEYQRRSKGNFLPAQGEGTWAPPAATSFTAGAEDRDPPSPISAPTVIAVGADHGGYRLKTEVISRLEGRGVNVRDEGTDSEDSCDYPVFARRVADRVACGEADFGIVIDGAGIGSTMVANKVPGVRAANCLDSSLAKNAREHNHANLLCLGSGWVDSEEAMTIIDAFLSTQPGGGRHARRVELFGDRKPKEEKR